MSFALENTKSDREFFVSVGKVSNRNSISHQNKDKLLENTAQDLDGFEQPKENQVGTWITTTPSGIRVGTEGAKQMDLEPLLIYHATDPADGTVLIFLCYYSTV